MSDFIRGFNSGLYDPGRQYPRMLQYATHLDQAVLWAHPKSSNSGGEAGIKQAVERLQIPAALLGLDLREPLHTSPHLADNIASLKETVTPQTLIIVRGGDGTLGNVAQAAAELGLNNPIFAIATGRKNDFAHSIFGRWALKHPEYAMLHSTVAPIHGVNITIQSGKQPPVNYRALGYGSKGVTDDVAGLVNKPEHRDRRYRTRFGRDITEWKIATDAFLHGETFPVTIDGVDQEAFDIIVSTINRMAGSLKLRVDPCSPEARWIVAKNKVHGLGVVAAMYVGLPCGTKMDIGDSHSIKTKGAEDGRLQVNGDLVSYPNPATITFGVGSPLNFLTTRRKARLH